MKMNPALGTPHPGDVLPKLENRNPALGNIHTVNDVPDHRTNTTYNKQRGKARGRVVARGNHTSGNILPVGERSGEEGLSSADEGGPSKKRRRSRKGMDRKYECSEKGCGRVYSRAEHLGRHKLNHNPQKRFYCDYEGCPKNFVRKDLCERHRERHEARGRSGAKLIKNEPAAYNPSPSINATNPEVPPSPALLSSSAIKAEDGRPPQHRHFNSQHESASSPTTIPSAADNSNIPTSGWFSPETSKSENGSVKHQNFHAQHESTSGTFAPTAAMPCSLDPSNTPTSGWFSRPNSHQVINQANAPSSRSSYPLSEHSGLKTNFHGPEHRVSFSNAPPISEGVFLHSPTRPADGRSGLDGMQQSLSQVSPFMNSSDGPGFFSGTNGLPYNAPQPATENDFSQQNYTPAKFMFSTSNISHPDSIDPSYSVPPGDQSVPMDFQHHSGSNNEHLNTEYIGVNQFAHLLSTGESEGYGYERSPNWMNPAFLRFLFPDQVDHMSLDGLPPAGTYSEVPPKFQHPMNHDSNFYGFTPGAITVNALVQQPILSKPPISDEKAQDLFRLINERFKESEESAKSPLKSKLLGGNRDQDDHILSTKKMQVYIDCFFDQFHPQIPILHKPTFTADKTHNLLLIAIMAIGASCLDRKHNYELSKSAAELSNFLAWHLRWEVFSHKDFQPPGSLWMFQTVLLLELYEKMYSVRLLHERAHIHHATTIVLMRRGMLWVGRPTDSRPQSPNRDNHDHPRRPSPVPGDTWWNEFIQVESRARASYAALLIDSTHAFMFGHSASIYPNELTLHLPCDDSVWEAPTHDECWRLQSHRGAHRPEISFLEGLKELIAGNTIVQTDSFGMTVLMVGLVSLFCHLTTLDQQLQSFGVGPAKWEWKDPLRKAFDNWSLQFDHFVSYTYRKPYPHHEELILGSRSVLHHLAHMGTYIDVVECQIFARATKVLGRVIGSSDLERVATKWKGEYHKTREVRHSVYYALSFLKSVLMPNERTRQSQAYANADGRYKARDDPLLNRPWVLYYATLVVWSYGFAKEGPTKEPIPAKHNLREQSRSLQEYLDRFHIANGNPESLAERKGLNGNSGLLLFVSHCFEDCRWDLLKEAQNLLANCVKLNTGQLK